MVSFRDLTNGLKRLELDPQVPVIAHASLSAFGEVRGGGETLLGALLAAHNRVVMPAFTYKTMIIPETGPENNGITYGSGKDLNRMAEFFRPGMPVDRMMGITAELLRQRSNALRSGHPILSFVGVNLETALHTQTIGEPLGPIRWVTEHDGWVILMGVDHSVNTCIHYAERAAGRKQFLRWALTPMSIRECPHFPGCSQGYGKAAPSLSSFTRTTPVGPAEIMALPLKEMVGAIVHLIQQDPIALLCDNPECERCNAVRRSAGCL
jgi:aminoglycoside 3-N-acetyltransferase